MIQFAAVLNAAGKITRVKISSLWKNTEVLRGMSDVKKTLVCHGFSFLDDGWLYKGSVQWQANHICASNFWGRHHDPHG
jgi:hypothetical protein